MKVTWTPSHDLGFTLLDYQEVHWLFSGGGVFWTTMGRTAIKAFGTGVSPGPLTWILDLKSAGWLPGGIDRVFCGELEDCSTGFCPFPVDLSMWDPIVLGLLPLYLLMLLPLHHVCAPVLSRP